MVTGCMAYIYKTQHLGVVALIFVLQGLIYREVVSLAINDSKERDMPGFNLFYYYWFIVCAFFMYTHTLEPYVRSGAESGDMAMPASLVSVVEYHVPISFALYIAGFMGFVISLRRRKNFRYQFSQFAYCHVALLVIVAQSTFLAANVFRGLIWFVLPCGLVVCNDIMAYLFGFFFGRTRLIKLSPKKTGASCAKLSCGGWGACIVCLRCLASAMFSPAFLLHAGVVLRRFFTHSPVRFASALLSFFHATISC